MVAPKALTEQDLVAARAELSAGKPFTVWFTAAAVGVPAGGSAKVISIDEAAEGDFIQVRPAGTRDTMFCSPSELTTTRPPRKRAQPVSQPADQPAGAQAAQPHPEPMPAPEKAPARPPAAPLDKAPADKAPAGKGPVEKAPERPRSAGSRSQVRPAEVSVTLHSTAEGEWTVEVMINRKRTVRPTAVQPGDVAKAARSLPSAVTEAIESSLDAARRRQVERVERLRSELDAAQRALQELSG
jgi:hypothetical protein